ncbi:MAG: hypothetical protein UT70_C0002G0066 [Candidatus Nomurabacteria bacterium GW2011_GWE2_40_10]|nr:MAG: hypothetical protein UT70_C0002G0066 [Candidatus Nomurabacteria bacterium GW2011_GWE2_40_10]
MSLSESGRIQQPVKQGFFDQFVLCVAYGIWRWRAETGRVNTNEEEMERRVDHHFAWMLVSREYYVPSYYQGSLRLRCSMYLTSQGTVRLGFGRVSASECYCLRRQSSTASGRTVCGQTRVQRLPKLGARQTLYFLQSRNF